MRILTVGILVGAAGLCSGRMAMAQVDVRYDGVQSVFSVAQTGQPFAISAAYACPGEAACRPAVVRVELGAYHRKTPRYDGNHAVQVVIDTKDSLSVESPHYAAHPAAANQVYESIVWMMDVDEFLVLANGEKVEYTIGPDEGELSDKQRESLTALAGNVPEPEQPKAETEEPEDGSTPP